MCVTEDIHDSTCEVPGQCSDETASEETASEETSSEEPVAESKVEEPVVEDPQCPSRPHIIRCAGAHLDLNKNNKLERTELVAAIDSLPWYARGILKIIGSVNKMMAKCDVDGDDAIGMDYDMEHNKETCLATCFKRKAFKRAFFADCEL